MDILYEVYKIAISYIVFIFKICISVLSFLLVCCFIIEKDYKIRKKYKDKFKRLKEIKEDHVKMLSKKKIKEVQ